MEAVRSREKSMSEAERPEQVRQALVATGLP